MTEPSANPQTQMVVVTFCRLRVYGAWGSAAGIGEWGVLGAMGQNSAVRWVFARRFSTLKGFGRFGSDRPLVANGTVGFTVKGNKQKCKGQQTERRCG